MKKTTLLAPLVAVMFGLSVAGQPPVTALPPHKLDKVFDKATSVKQVNEGLLNDPLFQKAVAEALKAKRAAEDNLKDGKPFAGPSPAQAARAKFLKVLADGEKDEAGAARK